MRPPASLSAASRDDVGLTSMSPIFVLGHIGPAIGAPATLDVSLVGFPGSTRSSSSHLFGNPRIGACFATGDRWEYLSGSEDGHARTACGELVAVVADHSI